VCTRRVIEVAYQCATSAQFEKSVDQRIGRTLGSDPSLCLYSREVRKSSSRKPGFRHWPFSESQQARVHKKRARATVALALNRTPLSPPTSAYRRATVSYRLEAPRRLPPRR
jgi:hypothetical protein